MLWYWLSKKITLQGQFLSALDSLLTYAEDLLVDIPKFWDFLAQVARLANVCLFCRLSFIQCWCIHSFKGCGTHPCTLWSFAAGCCQRISSAGDLSFTVKILISQLFFEGEAAGGWSWSQVLWRQVCSCYSQRNGQAGDIMSKSKVEKGFQLMLFRVKARSQPRGATLAWVGRSSSPLLPRWTTFQKIIELSLLLNSKLFRWTNSWQTTAWRGHWQLQLRRRAPRRRLTTQLLSPRNRRLRKSLPGCSGNLSLKMTPQ